jgi:RNA polymerase sigma-70 factor (ECF subfamily)
MEASALNRTTPSFHDQFVHFFDAHFHRIARVLERLSGETDLASDLAQEAFVRLYRRSAMPDSPEAWVISVAMNLFRNEVTTRARRTRLLKAVHGAPPFREAPPSTQRAAEEEHERRRVRLTLDRLSERERGLLVLHAEGYSYRDIANALELNEASVGTLLARARRAFRAIYEGRAHASD